MLLHPLWDLVLPRFAVAQFVVWFIVVEQLSVYFGFYNENSWFSSEYYFFTLTLTKPLHQLWSLYLIFYQYILLYFPLKILIEMVVASKHTHVISSYYFFPIKFFFFFSKSSPLAIHYYFFFLKVIIHLVLILWFFLGFPW